jgi:hypothetical protein
MAEKSNKNNVNVQIGGNVTDSTISVSGGDLHIGGESKGRPATDAKVAREFVADEGTLQLYRTLRDKFTLEEIEGICYELGVCYEDLPARTLSGKARQLVAKADALGKRDELSEIMKRERPQ